MWHSKRNVGQIAVYMNRSRTLIQEKFYSNVMNPDNDMASYILKLESLSRNLKQSGEPITDSMLITKILMVLPENYKTFLQCMGFI